MVNLYVDNVTVSSFDVTEIKGMNMSEYMTPGEFHLVYSLTVIIFFLTIIIQICMLINNTKKCLCKKKMENEIRLLPN